MTECQDQFQINFASRLSSNYAIGTWKVLGNNVSFQCRNWAHSSVHWSLPFSIARKNLYKVHVTLKHTRYNMPKIEKDRRENDSLTELVCTGRIGAIKVVYMIQKSPRGKYDILEKKWIFVKKSESWPLLFIEKLRNCYLLPVNWYLFITAHQLPRPLSLLLKSTLSVRCQDCP